MTRQSRASSSGSDIHGLALHVGAERGTQRLVGDEIDWPAEEVLQVELHAEVGLRRGRPVEANEDVDVAPASHQVHEGRRRRERIRRPGGAKTVLSFPVRPRRGGTARLYGRSQCDAGTTGNGGITWLALPSGRTLPGPSGWESSRHRNIYTHSHRRWEQPLAITRVQVEGGFLDGLDLAIDPGMTVLIGGRGTGKTSLIELIRFCLNAGALTGEAAERGRSHAQAILQDGLVTVTVSTARGEIAVSRAAKDESPRAESPIVPPLVLAQNEIEAVGAQSQGRIALLDRFRPDAGDHRSHTVGLVARLRAETSELSLLGGEASALVEQAATLAETPSALLEAARRQSESLRRAAATATDRKELSDLQQVSERLSVQFSALQANAAAFSTYSATVDGVLARVPTVQWPPSAGDDSALSNIRKHLDGLVRGLRLALGELSAAGAELATLLDQKRTEGAQVGEHSRTLRRRLDELDQGLGMIAREVGVLREQQGQLTAIRNALDEKRKQMDNVSRGRDDTYRRLDRTLDLQFDSRQSVARRLNNALGQDIRASVTRSADVSAYVNAIIANLVGSGLHYNTLAPRVASRMSPLELVTAVENGDADTLADVAEISKDRASAMIAHLGSSNTADIISAPIGDGVTLELLDGTDYKSTVDLSIGQRCTVVLSILLQAHLPILIVDQPEDHLDNSFVTNTLVETLRSRRPDDQMIFASHNANIPVLGEANRIVLVGSDGRRAFVRHEGELDAEESVRAVTSVMEGGLEAFRRRAEFYARVFPSIS